MAIPAPENLRITVLTDAACTLEWDSVEGAITYFIQRGAVQLGNTTGTLYTDRTSRIPGNRYTYGVRAYAVDPETGQAGYGQWATVSTKLATPENFQATEEGPYSVRLTWDAVPNARQYRIYRNGSFAWAVFETEEWTDTETLPGETLVYELYAVDPVLGEAEPSDPAEITLVRTQMCQSPGMTELSHTRTSVTLAATGGTAGQTYRLYRDGDLIASHTIGAGETTVWEYTDSGLTPKQYYTYSLTIAETGKYDSLSANLMIQAGREFSPAERQEDYFRMLKQPFLKLCRLRFLNPNGSTAFALDNNRKNKRSAAFIADGTVNANYQNGQRLSASVTLWNPDGNFDFSLGKIWFGQRVALDEGMVLSNGEEYWRQTGVFILDNPQENVNPGSNTVTYNLLDKWADLDGTLDGNLEASYGADSNTDIFPAMAALLAEDRGNGQPLDPVKPIFTEYYNDKYQTLPDGSVRLMTRSPYELEVDGDGGTVGSVLLELAGMVNAEIGYDNTGRLRIDPGQEDITDRQKPILYRFSQEETTLLGMSFTAKKSEVYNDYIVIGEQLSEYAQPGGRAMNYDPASDTNIRIIGRKTIRESASGYATNRQCMDLAALRLKRSGALQKAVNVSCSQMFHLELNQLVEIIRTDKPGSPREEHLIQGWSRPLAWNGPMTVSAVSVNDILNATVIPWGNEDA